MRKKFMSVLLFGALAITSTSTFQSCKDYDDDIDGLRTEINDNATVAASELASKVNELKNQITSLESAKDKLSTELAAAKQEAATAAANALSAAQKAQAAADAAQKGGDEAKAAAAAAQQTADQATKDLASAVARVATLETKVASLESAVADLKKADSEFSSRLTVLENSIKQNQEAIATNKNGIAENKQAIADANAAILAKATELKSAINDLSVKVGAQIDVINAELNTIKSNYATKDELNSKYQELAAMDAQLKNQIETNANYIAALQTTVKELAAKDAELASKIESNYNAIIEKLNATNTELTAANKKIEAIENTVSSLSSQYSALQSAKADLTYVDNINTQLTTLINSLQSTLNDLSTSNASQDRTIADLLASVKNLQEKTQDLQNQVDKNNAAQTAALQAAVAQLQKEIADAVKGAQDELTAAVADVKTLAQKNEKDIETIKADLAKKAEQSALDALAADLANNYATVAGVNAQIATVQGDLLTQKSELEEKIAAAEAAAKAYADGIVNALSNQVDLNTGDIATNKQNIQALQEFMEDLTNISGEDLSAFVTDNKMDKAITDALDDFYVEISQEFMGQTEFTEWVTRELRGQILSEYVTGDALSQELNKYLTVQTYNTDMEALNKIISNDVKGEERGLTQRIKDCEEYLLDLGLVNTSISKRLTSITLVPQHYIGGIEAINFKTLTYNAWNNGAWVQYRLTNDEGAKVVYRMNPSGVTLDCIDRENVSYIANAATTRAHVDCPIQVTGCNVDEDGDLVVNVKKKDAYVNKNIATTPDGKLWIAALSIPINKKYWTVEDENAVVYSEYTRLSETEFTPILMKKGAVHTDADIHLWNWDILYNTGVDEKVYKEFAFDSDPIDLMTLVDVCEGNGSGHVTFVDYESYGLKIKFEIPPYGYNQDQGTPATEQQKFAYLVDDTHIASCVYDGGTKYTKNAAAVGREPIVKVTLIDTKHDNNVVSEKYFKIKWTKKTPVDLGAISESTNNFSCNGFSQLLNTQEMNQKIYGADEINMGSTTFHTIYPDANLKKVSGVGTINLLPNTVNGVTSYNLQWNVTPAEFQTVQGNPFTNDKEIAVNYVWEAADGSGDIKFSMKKTVKAPSFGIKGHNGAYWNDNYSVLTMNPIVYNTPNAEDLCVINADLVNNFAKGNRPATDMLDAITITNFTGTPATAEIYFKGDNDYTASFDGKTLYKNNVVAATIEEDINNPGKQILVLREEKGGNPTYGTTDYGTAQSIPTSAALSLIGKNIPVKVVVDACGTGVYTYTAKDFSVKIKEPFKIDSDLNDVFYESRVNGSRISVANALTMTDWNGYVVAQAADGSLGTAEKYKWTSSLYNYYGITKVEWATREAKTNIVNVNGNLVPTAGKRNSIFPDGASFTYDPVNNELVYVNNGIALGKEFEIYCPVKVTYKWGVAEVVGGVTITVKAGSGI